MTDSDMDRRDVEKRWSDPALFRAAAFYAFSVIALAAAAFAATVVWRSMLAAVLVPVILFVGGVVALVQTYRIWKAGGVWAIWQGAAWLLLFLFLFCLGVPMGLNQP